VILVEGTSGRGPVQVVPPRILVLVMLVVRGPIVKRMSSAKRTPSAKRTAVVARGPDIERREVVTVHPVR
jgi:hypothetical protein